MRPAPSSSGLLAPAVIAALVAATVSFATTWIVAWREERSRRRKMFADAFEAYVSYKEFPYAIRRRRGDQLSEERQRISGELRHLQERLSFFMAWTQVESPKVGAAYTALVEGLRRIAGAEIAKAWTLEPISRDEEMNIGDVNLSSLKPLEDAYFAVLKRRVGPLRTRLRWRKNETTA